MGLTDIIREIICIIFDVNISKRNEAKPIAAVVQPIPQAVASINPTPIPIVQTPSQPAPIIEQTPPKVESASPIEKTAPTEQSKPSRVLDKKYHRTKPKGKTQNFNVYLVTNKTTFHTPVKKHEIDIDGKKETLYWIAQTGFNYLVEEIEENEEHHGGRLDNIEHLGQVGGNVLFLEDCAPSIRGKLFFGDIDFTQESWDDLAPLDKDRMDDQITETNVNENEVKYINPETPNFLLYIIIMGVIAIVLFGQVMGNIGVLGAEVDKLCHPMNYMNATTNTSYITNTTAVISIQNKTPIITST